MELFKLFGTIGLNGVEQTQQDIRETTDQARDSGNKMAAAFKKVGAAVITYLSVDAIRNFGQAAVEASAQVSAEISAFEQIMGEYANTAKTKMTEVADATGVVDSRLTTYMTSMTAKFKGLGYDIETATTLASGGLMLASDAAAFWDKSLDESMSHLNSFINGSYEGGEAIGLFANDTQMAAYAVEAGIISETKAWASLDEALKQATRLEYAQLMFEQSGAAGQAAKEADQYANVTANLRENWRQFLAVAGEPILQNIVAPIIRVLSTGVEKLTTYVKNLTAGWTEGNDIVTILVNTYQAIIGKVKEAVTWVKENKTTVQLLAIGIGTLTAAIVAYNIAQAISNAGGIAAIAQLGIMTVQVYALDVAQKIATISTTAFGAAVNFLTSPITLVILAIGALIAIGVLLYKNWDTIKAKAAQMAENIKAKFEGLKNSIAAKFDGIKNSIKSKIEWARDKVKAAVDKIKSFFNFKVSLPHIKLPHFSITPSGWNIGDLLKGSIPKLGIRWYAKAMDNPMILNSPTIFGAADGQLLGGGEAGAEVVGGKDTLLSMMKDAVGTEVLNKTLTAIYDLLNDEDRAHDMIVKALVDGSFAVELDNREVGRIVRKYAG